LVHAENPPVQCLPRLGLAKAALRVGKRVYIRRCLERQLQLWDGVQ
jgi:hypothetical protein